MFGLSGLVNVWPAGDWMHSAGGVPVKPSYSRDSVAVLVRLQWEDGHSLWVPGHANRWNKGFVCARGGHPRRG